MIAYASLRPTLVSAAVLCDSPRDVGGGGDVHAFPVVSAGAQFILRTDHSSLRWLQRFRNEDGMLARWYLLLGQFSVTFEYRPGAQHANADGMSRQCGQCQRPDCPVLATDSLVPDAEPEPGLVDQPFASSEMGESMDADLLPVCEWVQSGTVPVCAECAGLSPELRCWCLQVGNLSMDTDGRLWRRQAPPSDGSELVVPRSEIDR